MDKATFLRRMRTTHADLVAAASALSDADLAGSAPRLEGWTRKDVLAHMEWWNEHSTRVVESARSGGTDPDAASGDDWDIDTHNARVLAENRDREPSDVRQGEAASFARLMATVAATPEDLLFAAEPVAWLRGTVAEVVASDSSNHYPEHLPHLAPG